MRRREYSAPREDLKIAIVVAVEQARALGVEELRSIIQEYGAADQFIFDQVLAELADAGELSVITGVAYAVCEY